MKALVFCLSVAALLAVSAVCLADSPGDGKPDAKSPETVIYDADAAFNFLAGMKGDWSRGAGDHDHGSSSRGVNFRVTAAGSAVMETLYAGQPSEMITMFHMNGDELLLTHYCALSNAPVMKFVKSDKPGEIRFDFYGGTNFDAKVDHHVHQGVYQVIDANHVNATFTSWDQGKPRPSSTTVMTRKTADAEHDHAAVTPAK